MDAHARRGAAALSALAVCLLLGACGKSGQPRGSGEGPTEKLAPVAAQGALSLSTRNTTRVGGSNVAADAAAVARAVYPGLTVDSRPQAVVLADTNDFASALAASLLAGAPAAAPVLFSEGGQLPAITREALEALHPTGLPALGGAQVLTIGPAPALPAGLLAHEIPVGEPAVSAANIEQTQAGLPGVERPRQVIVVPAAGVRALAMPAAGLAAESGAPILFATRARVPAATAKVLGELRHPAIYLIDPAALGSHTRAELAHFGAVTPIAPTGTEPRTPSGNSVAVARFTDGNFGWGVKEPGHGLVFASAGRPLDAPAAALLSATGEYAPLLLVEGPNVLPAPVAAYLADIQPAYTSAPQFRPVHGVYNHGWLIGDEAAISAPMQAQIDSLLEISPRRASSEEAAATPAE